jgi:hypothetical protein
LFDSPSLHAAGQVMVSRAGDSPGHTSPVGRR